MWFKCLKYDGMWLTCVVLTQSIDLLVFQTQQWWQWNVTIDGKMLHESYLAEAARTLTATLAEYSEYKPTPFKWLKESDHRTQ